ncbi:MAG TPA: DUF6125 family protein [Methanoregulaceae archaeon]|nr:DUF6125 family protein [Methanoregulaceae archaeon]
MQGSNVDLDLIDAAKDWLAIDGLWFLVIEKRYGLETAMKCDREVWEQYSAIEARRVMERLGLSEFGGLEALELALQHRLYYYLNPQTIVKAGPETLILYIHTCRVHAARERKALKKFPCKSIGQVEYEVFARTIDPRITTECLCCPPDHCPQKYYCAWRFRLDFSK